MWRWRSLCADGRLPADGTIAGRANPTTSRKPRIGWQRSRESMPTPSVFWGSLGGQGLYFRNSERSNQSHRRVLPDHRCSTWDTTSNTGIRYFYVPLVCGTGDRNSPVHIAEQIHAPVLLIHGDRDTEVPTEQSLRMQEALSKADRHVELVVIDGGDHGFKGEQDEQAWSAATRFFNTYLGSRE